MPETASSSELLGACIRHSSRRFCRRRPIFPLAALILGLILGDQIEVNLVRALMSDANGWLFFSRPISGARRGLSIASVAFALWQHYRHQKRKVVEETDPDF